MEEVKEKTQNKSMDNGASPSTLVQDSKENGSNTRNGQMEAPSDGDKIASQIQVVNLVEEALNKVEASMVVLDAGVVGSHPESCAEEARH